MTNEQQRRWHHVVLLMVTGCLLTMSREPLSAQKAPVVSAPETSAPEVAQLRLVRCGPHRTAACLTTRLTLSPRSTLGDTGTATPATWQGTLAGVSMIGPEQAFVSAAKHKEITPVFGVPLLPMSSLGRSALLGTVALASGRNVIIRVPAQWRPPMLTLPAFNGAADSMSLSAPTREALAAGVEPPSVRPLLLIVFALAGMLLVVFVPRFLWAVPRESDEDMARQVAAARALLSTQEFEQMRGRAPRETKPRTAEDETKPVRSPTSPPQ